MALEVAAVIIPKAVAVVCQLTKAKSNDTLFELLAERIKATTIILEKLKEQGVPIQGVVQTGVNEFTSVLDSASRLLEEYEFSGKMKRVLKAHILRDKITLMNERLSNAQQHLNFALCVERRSPVQSGNMGMNLMPWHGGGGGGAAAIYPSVYTPAATAPCQSVYVGGGGGGGVTIIYPSSYTTAAVTSYTTGYVAGAWGNPPMNACSVGMVGQVVCTPYGVAATQTVVAPFWR